MDIEAALEQSFDRATLAVYADELQQRGDPRGELIAIDLHTCVHGSTRELAEKKRELVRAWLGDGLWNYRHFRFGFFDDYRTSYADSTAYATAVARSAAGPYIRGLTLHAPTVTQAQLDLVVAREHRWLQRLSIGKFSVFRGAAQEWCAAMPAATPNLVELAISGQTDRTVATKKFLLDHPNVRRLVLEHSPLEFEDGIFPSTVEVALVTGEAVPFRDELPNVRTIDVTHFAVPASVPRSITHARVRSSLRAFRLQAKFPHVSPVLEPRPWLDADGMAPLLVVGDYEVPQLRAIEVLEHCFDEMAPCEQAAIRELFAASETTAEIAARAVLALDQARVTSHRWETLVTGFMALPPHTVLRIRRS